MIFSGRSASWYQQWTFTNTISLFRAGGGGKSQSRKEKLKEKNKKLAQERDKIAQEQKKDKSKKSAQSGDEPQANGTNETNGEAQNDYTAVHPSRLGLMGGGGQWGRRR